ncbi:hypothetical protein CASFOL_015203 [Castilleja foliolosa]|uniref:Uncharacterized protein n=1 Tax=Castilleja foliolosa TaxID=1961234 RepID=A0ABD3DD31_9LAMI
MSIRIDGLLPSIRIQPVFQRPRSTSLRFTVKASGSAHFPGDEDFGLYPWENPDITESCFAMGNRGESDFIYF